MPLYKELALSLGICKKTFLATLLNSNEGEIMTQKNSYGQISKNYWFKLEKEAQKLGISFDITPKYAWGLFLQQGSKCALSGLNIKFKNRTATIARVDNKKGYIPGNIHWVHKKINDIKSGIENNEFIDLCFDIVNYQNSLKAEAEEVIPELEKRVLVDGFDIVVDTKKSFGSWLVDARNGRRYLDLFSQFSSQPLGWNYPAFVERLDEFPEVASVKLTHSDVYTTHYAKFVQKLSYTLPEFSDFFFITSGALAVENALKAAFDWKVQKLGIENDQDAINKLDVAHFERAFHGRSGYCLSLTNTDPNKIKWFPKFDWSRFSTNEKGLCNLERALEKNNIAAVIIEPIMSEGGDIHLDKQFIMALRNLTNKYEALLIFDEVQTGFSTGKYWCYQHFDVVPDLIAFGKKIQTCGIASTRRIHEVKSNVFVSSSRINATWCADIVDMVRSTIVMDIIQKEKLIEKSNTVGSYFVEQLNELGLKNVRGRGLLVAFDLDSSEERDIFLQRLNEKVLCLKCGEKSIRFRPHLTVTKDDIDTAIKEIKAII